MKRIILFILLSSFAFCENAVLINISGKVEINRSESDSWIMATEGIKVELSDSISTGFGASATLDTGNSQILIRPLSRMTMDMFLKTSNKVHTSLFLQVGAVTAEVDDSSNIKQNFQVQSPFSTASVRGTIFDYDGRKLTVHKGTVAVIPGKPIRIIQNELLKKLLEDDVTLTDEELLQLIEAEIIKQQEQVDESQIIYVNTGESIEIIIPLTATDNTKDAVILTNEQIIIEDSKVLSNTSKVENTPFNETSTTTNTDITVIWEAEE